MSEPPERTSIQFTAREHRWLTTLLILATIAAGFLVLGFVTGLLAYFNDIIFIFFLAWLLAFILSSMLVKTRLAKRMALWLVVRFGHKANWALLAFVILQLALAPLIPATAARCVMTLPLISEAFSVKVRGAALITPVGSMDKPVNEPDV